MSHHGSWLKRGAGVRANRSVDRLVSRSVAPSATCPRAAPAALDAPRPGGRPPPRAGRGHRPGPAVPAPWCGVRWGAAARAASSCCSRSTAAPRSDRRSSSMQAPVTAARPRAVPVAPAAEVPYQKSTTGTRTQLNAAQRTTSLTVSAEPAAAGRRAAGVPGWAPGRDPDAGAAGDAGGVERGRAVSGPGTWRSLVLLCAPCSPWRWLYGVQRVAAPPVTARTAVSAVRKRGPVTGRRGPAPAARRRPSAGRRANRLYRAATVALRAPLVHAPWNAAHGARNLGSGGVPPYPWG